MADVKTEKKFASLETAKKINDDVASLKEDISTKITKFYASSQGETHLADSDNGKIMDIMVYGRSEQKQYSGKNLLNMKKATVSGWNININIPLEKSKTYTFTNGAKANNGVALLGINPNEKDEMLTKKYLQPNESFTFTCLKNYEAILLGGSDATTNIDGQYMLELGSEATPYEPYTGGIPSPNPEYPQEIVSAGSDGKIGMEVRGKNLFDFSRLVSDGVNVIDYDNQTITIPARTNNTGYNQTLRDLCPGITPGTYVFSIKRSNPNSGSGSYFLETEKDFPVDTSFELTDELLDNHIAWYNNPDSDVENVISEIQIESGNAVTSYEPYHEPQSLFIQTPTGLPAIPVTSGGNYTDANGQQWIADYVDVERGKLVKKLKSFTVSDIKGISTWGVNKYADNITGFYFYMYTSGLPKANNEVMTSTILRHGDEVWGGRNVGCAVNWNATESCIMLSVPTNMLEDISSDKNACASFVKICENTNAIFFYSMASPIETDLTPEEIEAFKELVTYYPVTNISVNSEQLDGYTVFNYPISMKNGWDYVKKQLNDNRDYIYNMDTKTQDIDTQAAEAYVNSEYAVALTELEV